MDEANSTTPTSTRLLVIGASAGIGLEVVKQALATGLRVRAFARSALSMGLEHERLEIFAGDALDATAVQAALKDIDAVVQALGVPFNARLFTGPITLFSAATEILLRAMDGSDCRRLLAVTGFGAGDSQASIHPLQRLGFNLVFGRAYADKSKQEQKIKNSDLDWTIVRPGVLTSGRNAEHYRVLINPGDWRNGVVARAAVANFLVRSVADQNTFSTSPVIIG